MKKNKFVVVLTMALLLSASVFAVAFAQYPTANVTSVTRADGVVTIHGTVNDICHAPFVKRSLVSGNLKIFVYSKPRAGMMCAQVIGAGVPFTVTVPDVPLVVNGTGW
jgi:type 1 fimbria pilin